MILSLTDFEHLQSAMALMAWAHKGQTRKKNSTPYESHPRRVHAMGAALGYPLHVQMALLWHDVMEDGPEEARITHALIEIAYERFGIPEPLARDAAVLVSTLTKYDDQTKEEYLHSIGKHGSPWPILMKVLDRIDNLREGQATLGVKWLRRYLTTTDLILTLAKGHSARLGGRPEVMWLQDRYDEAYISTLKD